MTSILYRQMYFSEDLDWSRYEVSNIGLIKDKRTSMIAPVYQSTNGQMYVLLEKKDNLKQYYLLDRIIAATFDAPVRPNKQGTLLTVNHIDGNFENNLSDNLEWIEDEEVWKIITYPGIISGRYLISNHGNVKNIEHDKILSQNTDKDGYLRLGLYGDDKRLFVPVHRLVAFEFVKMPSNYSTLSVNHIDGNKLNNHYLNLEWVDNTTNQRHAWLTGLKTAPAGEDSASSILTNDQVRLICELIVKHEKKMPLIMDEIKNRKELCNVNRNMVESIRNKQTWDFISDNYFSYEDFRQRLRPDEVREICELLLINQMDCNAVLDEFNNSHDYRTTLRTIQRIKGKEMWKTVSDDYF